MVESGTKTYTHAQKQGKPKWAKLSTHLLPKHILFRQREAGRAQCAETCSNFSICFCVSLLHAYQWESEQDEGLKASLRKLAGMKIYLLFKKISSILFASVSLLRHFFSLPVFLSPLSSPYLEIIDDTGKSSISCYPH